jgi:hypothetical protein
VDAILMTERYPPDAELLALDADAHTGVEYIPTGTTPYYLVFRKLLQRTLLAAARANDLRVYACGDLAIGVRPGRCLIDGSPIAFAGQTDLAIDPSATTDVYLDPAGTVTLSTDGLPDRRSQFIPLARVVADASAITSLTDLRGEAFLASPSGSLDDLAATSDEINQALDGIGPSVTANALGFLTDGSTLQSLHYHERFFWDTAAPAWLTLVNAGGSGANIGLRFDLLNLLPDVTELAVDPTNGFLTQRYDGQTYPLLGTAAISHALPGDITASQVGVLIGPAPCDGVIDSVVLSLGRNVASSDPTDGLVAAVMVNGVAVCTTDPAIASAAGAGFRCTHQGDGTPATVKSDGSQQVNRGDILTLDLTLTANGSLAVDPADAAVLVLLRPSHPG